MNSKHTINAVGAIPIITLRVTRNREAHLRMRVALWLINLASRMIPVEVQDA
jgi:hypothetical protein